MHPVARSTSNSSISGRHRHHHGLQTGTDAGERFADLIRKQAWAVSSDVLRCGRVGLPERARSPDLGERLPPSNRHTNDVECARPSGTVIAS